MRFGEAVDLLCRQIREGEHVEELGAFEACIRTMAYEFESNEQNEVALDLIGACSVFYSNNGKVLSARLIYPLGRTMHLVERWEAMRRE